MSDFILRPYQEACVEAVQKDLEKFNSTCVIMSTGAGKTEVFVMIAKNFLKQNPNKKIIVLSHLSLLTTQTRARFFKRTPELRVGVLQGQKRPSIGDKVIIATMQSAQEEKKTLSWLMSENDVGLVISDEFHRALGTNTFAKVMKQHNAKLLGVTATPFREGTLITNMFDSIAFTMSMQELIEQKYLVPFDMRQILMEAFAPAEERIAKCVQLYEELEQGKKAVIFLRTMEDAELARNAFDYKGIKACLVTSNINWKVRDKIMHDFNSSDDIKVLCTCDVLSAGIDMPKLEVIMMPYGTKSPALFLQRCGRGSRPEDCESLKAHHSKQSCRVYMVGDAPTIKSGFYRKLMDYTLNEGSKDKKTSVLDEFEFLKLAEAEQREKSEKYTWTQKVCEVVRLLEKGGHKHLEDMLKYKKFPNRYLNNIDMLEESIFYLDGDSFEDLDKALRENNKRSKSWIIPTGKMAGRHVKEVPYFYRSFVLSKYPHSYIGQLLHRWYNLKER